MKKIMNKKAFTLVELLAIILILGIVAVIAIPVTSKILKEAKKSSSLVSANNYLNATYTLLAKNDLYNIATIDGSYDPASFIMDNLKGTLPSTGTVVIELGQIKSINLCINNFSFSYNGDKMVYVSDDCTVKANKPVYTVVEDPSEVTGSKTIMISYGSDSEKSYFMVNSGTVIYESNVVTNGEWILASSNDINVKFTSNGSLVTKKETDTDTVIGNVLNINNIDSVVPVINFASLPTTINYDASNPDTVYSYKDFVTFGDMGGFISCNSDLNPTLATTKTSSLSSGVNNLTCIATGSNGLVSTTTHTITVNVNTSYAVNSLSDSIKNLELPNGDYSLTVNTGTETITYPIELINYYNDVEISTNTYYGDSSTTKKMLVVKFHKNLTVNSGATITATNVSGLTYKKGMYIYVGGTLTNNGIISMTARGTYNEPGQNIYLFKNNDNTYEFVPATGGAGGVQARITAHGATGGAGASRQTGGGGSGSSMRNATKGGNGSAGTAYSGGSGGGGASSAADSGITGGNAAGNGGAGGAAVGRRTTATMYVSSGGAGNPSGRDARPSSGANVTVTGNYTPSSDSGTGGLLIIYTDKLVNNGEIVSKGSSSRPPVGYNTNVCAPGGSSGGGSINIFTPDYENNGTVSAAGGTSVASVWLVGGHGGTGTVTIGSIATGKFIKY